MGHRKRHGSSCCLSEKPPTQIWMVNPSFKSSCCVCVRAFVFVCTCVADSRSTMLHFWKNELLALKSHSITFLIHQVFYFLCLDTIGVYILLKWEWSAWGVLFPPSSLSFCLLICKSEKYIFCSGTLLSGFCIVSIFTQSTTGVGWWGWRWVGPQSYSQSLIQKHSSSLKLNKQAK